MQPTYLLTTKLKEKREQNLSRDQKLSNEEFDEYEQKEIRSMNLN